MKLGKYAECGTVTISVSIPTWLYDQLKPRFHGKNRSREICYLIKVGLEHG